MPIHVICTGCQAKLKAPDTAAGKKTKCPKCQTIVSVPAGGAVNAAASKSSAVVGAVKKNKPDQWFLQTPDGSQYGPVVRDELDQWFSEGRVSVECQLLKEGSTQWQWAADLYPELSKLPGSLSNSSPAPLTSSPLSSAAVSLSPLTPLSSAGAFSDPLASMPPGTPALSPLGSAPSSTTTLPSYTSSPSLGAYAPSSGISPNPYSASTLGGNYGAYPQRTGPHPMVIVAGIFHILMGCWNALNCFLCSIGGLALMAIGGAVGAAGSPDPGAEGAKAALAAFGVVGGLIAFVLALIFLAYGVMQVFTAIGLFQRRQWARTATFVFASMGVVATLVYLALIVLTFDIASMIGLMGEIVYVPILFLAMLLPDANRGFR